MTSTTRSLSPLDVVHRNFEAFQRGDLAAMRAGWHDDAVWHITGSSSFAGDVPIDQYVQLLGAVTGGPGYRTERLATRAFGELVVVELRSEGRVGDIEVDGSGGLLVYRVVDGKVAEGWGIAAGSGGRLPF